MIETLLALIITSTSADISLTPYEHKLYDGLVECRRDLKTAYVDLKACNGTLARETALRLDAEKKLIDSPPPAATPSSPALPLVKLFVPAGASALGAIVSAIVCAKTSCDPDWTPLIIGGSSAGASLGATIVVLLLE